MLPTASLNLDDSGTSLPVVVRVYQLRSKDKFQQAPFNTLWKSDKEVLEGDLVERKEVMIHPEMKAVLDIDVDLKHGAAFLGVMALFRKPNVDGWKQVVIADSCALCLMTPKMKLVLDRNTIKLAK
jgi:type VI secretion system protein VasD